MIPERGIGAIFSDLLGEVTALFRNEIRLAKAEVSEKVSRMVTGLVLTLAGAFLLLLALVFLLEAAVGGLMMLNLSLALSSLIVGAVILIAGGIVVWLGVSRLKIGKLSRSKTAQQLKEDAAVARYQVHAS
jgi:uncharacterized membrane protein